MTGEIPLVYDLIVVTAIDHLANSYRRTIHELTETKEHPTFGESAKLRIDILADMFNQVKADNSILDLDNAATIQRLTESYYLNTDYKSIVRQKTFELVAFIGEDGIKHLAKVLSTAYTFSSASVATSTVSQADLANTLLKNPWLIMLILTVFARVVDQPGVP